MPVRCPNFTRAICDAPKSKQATSSDPAPLSSAHSRSGFGYTENDGFEDDPDLHNGTQAAGGKEAPETATRAIFKGT